MLQIDEQKVRALPGAGLLAGMYYDPYPARFAANLKEALASGTRLLVRLHPGVRYPLDDERLTRTLDREGHVVAVVGYDDETDTMIVADPWDRERFGGEDGGVRAAPHTELALRWVNATLDKAMAVFPLAIELSTATLGEDTSALRADVRLCSPAPQVGLAATTLSEIAATVKVPDGIELLSDGRQAADLLAPGESTRFTWHLRHAAPVEGTLEVAVAAVAEGSDPYEFRDVVGTSVAARVRSRSLAGEGIAESPAQA